VQRMSRRSRHARSALNQPDLFSFPQLMIRQEEASVCHETKPRVIEQRPVSKPEPKVHQAAATPIIRPERRQSREPPSTPVHLLDVRAAAAWLGLSKSTLDKMRCYGVGPRFIRATGRAVRYDPADLAAFAEGRRQSRTSDEVPA
jgi:predicted DNA-binding transcriptional regulator AlpA